jgi:hypothetical protein
MKVNMHLFAVISLFIALFPNTSIANNCSCLTFFEVKPKPDWVSAEKITASHYSTYGASYCTGLQIIDVGRSDKSAKANLSRMIQAQIKSTQNIKQSNFGNGATFSHLTENTTVNTDLILAGSLVYDRWIDPKSCTIFSATQINIAAINKAILDQKSREAAKLINQFYSVSEGQHPIVKSKIESALSDILVRFSIGKDALIISNRVFDIKEKPGRLVSLTLEIEIVDPRTKQSIWKKGYAGKGLSFKDTRKSILVKKALNSAMKNATKELQAFIVENKR